MLEWVAISFSPSRAIEAGEVSEATGRNQRGTVRPVRADVLVPPMKRSCQFPGVRFPHHWGASGDWRRALVCRKQSLSWGW